MLLGIKRFNHFLLIHIKKLEAINIKFNSISAYTLFYYSRTLSLKGKPFVNHSCYVYTENNLKFGDSPYLYLFLQEALEHPAPSSHQHEAGYKV